MGDRTHVIDIEPIPSRTLEVNEPLERIFRTYRNGSPVSGWFFSSTDLARPGRFDLARPHGTCSFSDDIVGCWLETFRNTTTIAVDDVATRHVATAHRTQSGVNFIDITDPQARGTGVTLDLSSGRDHTGSQNFAADVRRRGHSGIVSWVRHDPATQCRSYALFGYPA